jgi:uncharacterized protein YbjT (DUF2867 family)
MIVVTGATGQLGQRIVEQLLRRVSPEQVGATARDPKRAEGLAARGARVRPGDFDAPADLERGFEGASQLLLVSSNARAYGGDTLAQHRSAIAAAKAAGVRRIVYTSHMAASADSAFPPMHDHAATEELLRSSGLAWTALRNGFYASSAVTQLGDAPRTGVLEAPADGKIAWTTHDDLAEAAALVLLREGRFEGPTPPLTGRQALDLSELAAMASKLAGRPIERRVLADEELQRRMAARGLPERAVTIALGLFRASRGGEFSACGSTLEELLGRAPVSMEEVLAAALGA